ncbi:MAG: DUF2149 domain-containing protein, partial [Methanosarcina sp.]|nr:DUF2149 domain-containing protein [Methanosarcina sp.]
LNMTDSIGGGTGEALGTAYRLADGRVIYVPDDFEGNETSTSTSSASSMSNPSLSTSTASSSTVPALD